MGRKSPEVPLRVARRRRRAEEWALVLAAEGLAAKVSRGPSGFVLGVAPEDADRALAAIEAYERENPASPSSRETSQPPADPAPLRVALGVSGALLAFFALTGPRDPVSPWFERGSAHAERILAGEIWRTVTSLTLHADLGHVAANAIIGALFLTAVCRALGPGLGCALVLLAGATGNLANALFRGPLHDSVGASTAVFGAVGLLGGLGVGRRHRGGMRGRRAWVSVAAALGLLAMLGTAGERVDLWAHFFGLALGGLLGIPIGFAAHCRPAAGLQWLIGGAALATLLTCWALALP
jgi:membrane associated rhomboid family serine protease